jgi:hypothetical protein
LKVRVSDDQLDAPSHPHNKKKEIKSIEINNTHKNKSGKTDYLTDFLDEADIVNKESGVAGHSMTNFLSSSSYHHDNGLFSALRKHSIAIEDDAPSQR